MIVTRYKEWLRLDVSYKTKAGTFISDNISIEPSASTQKALNDMRTIFKRNNSVSQCYYTGNEINNSIDRVSYINNGAFLFFKVQFEDANQLAKLNLFNSSDTQNKRGFPKVFKGIAQANFDDTALIDEHVKAVGNSLAFSAKSTALTGKTAQVEIKNMTTKENVFDDFPLLRNKEGNYEGTLDLSKLTPDVYEFKTGADKQYYFVDSLNELRDCTFIIRITQNDFLKYETAINGNGVNTFSLQIQLNP